MAVRRPLGVQLVGGSGGDAGPDCHSAEKRVSPPQEGSMASLLIIEDETNIRRFVAANLAARGYKVQEAGDAEQGLEILRSSPPAALILDIRLPGMSGWDLLQLMTADAQLTRVPVIVMTASVTNVRFGENSYSNVVQWLVKPVSVHELIHAVKKAVSNDSGSEQVQ